MNELVTLFQNIKAGEHVRLERKIYHAYQDDCFYVTGYYCSNTASYEENPNGERFAAIYLKEVDNVVIDGNGATLMIHGKMTPFVFDNCKNITLKNLTIDYARPTMSEFTVTKVEGNVAYIHVNDEYLYEIVDGILYWVGEKNLNGQPYWRHAYRTDDMNVLSMQQTLENNYNYFCPSEEGNRPSVPAYKIIEVIDKNTLKLIYDNECPLVVNTTYQTRHIVRDQIGGLAERCENVVYDNLTIYAMHGFGILSQFCDNVTVKNITAIPKKGRTITSNADFFQFSGCKGNVIIENCVMSAGHDDFINLHGTYLQITGYDKKQNALSVEFKQSQSWGFTPFYAGDKIEIIYAETMLFKEENIVLSVEKLSPFVFKLYLKNKPQNEVVHGDVIENITWTPSLTVKNCRFYESMAHGILCTTRGQVRIEDCVFEKLGYEAIAIAGETKFWFESGKITDVLIKNCVFKDVGYGPSGKKWLQLSVKPFAKQYVENEYFHDTLTLENNRFEIIGEQEDFLLKNIRRVVFKNNTFSRKPRFECEHVGEIIGDIYFA